MGEIQSLRDRGVGKRTLDNMVFYSTGNLNQQVTTTVISSLSIIITKACYMLLLYFHGVQNRLLEKLELRCCD